MNGLPDLARLLQLERPLVDLDLETSGIFPKKDRILQVGVIKFYPDGNVTEWQTLVNPGITIDPEATAVHKIDNVMIADAPRFVDIAAKLYTGLDGCDIMGYNLKVFDIPFLQEEFARCNIIYREPRVIDVFKLYQRLVPRNLTAAVKDFLGESFDTAHDALSDTRATARVLAAMLERHADVPRNVQAIHDLLFTATNGLDVDKKFMWKGTEVVLAFGKFAGQPISAATRCGCHGRCVCVRGYLEWMAGPKGTFADDTKTIARNALRGELPRKG